MKALGIFERTSGHGWPGAGPSTSSAAPEPLGLLEQRFTLPDGQLRLPGQGVTGSPLSLPARRSLPVGIDPLPVAFGRPVGAVGLPDDGPTTVDLEQSGDPMRMLAGRTDTMDGTIGPGRTFARYGTGDSKGEHNMSANQSKQFADKSANGLRRP
jgi:hypothetical protein